MKRTLFLATIFAAAWFVSAAFGETGNELFQKALVKERSEGNLKEAIKLYQQVVEKYGKDRALAARALMAIGESQAKLGETEARKTYERVIKDYADQKEAVTLARARLAHSEVPMGIMSRKIWTGPKVDVYGSVSSDGRYLSFVDWENNGNLGLHYLTTGVDRLITSGGEAEYSTISRDGKTIAYAWFKPDVWRYEIRLANLTGNANPRRLFDNAEVEEISPYDWSPDGKWIAVSVRRKDHTAQIGLLSSADGALRVLKTTDWSGSTRMFFSPDGQFVAYDLPSVDAGNQRDVYVMAIDGSREIPAVLDPNQDIVMGWSPDGRFLLFGSDRSGSMSLWALPFRAGKPQGAPELLKSDIGTFESSMGITAAGALYFGKTGRSRSVEVASVDWAAGKLLTPLPVRRFVGSHTPSWSSDGKFLACVSGPDLSGANKVLAMFSLDTGQVVRESHPRMGFVSSAQLAPDARSFAVQGTDLKGRSGIFQVEALSGEVTSIAVSEERGEGRPESLVNPAWSPDGKKLYYQKLSPVSQEDRSIAFIEKDLVSGKEREIIRRTTLGATRISPDGRYIATPSSDPATKSATVLLIPLDGGEPRELLRVKQPSQFRIPGWAPDSGAVIVWKILTNESTLTEANSSHEVWRVPIGAEQPRKLEIDMRTLKASGPVAFSPDGRHLAYPVTGESTSEVSVVENMLPALGSK